MKHFHVIFNRCKVNVKVINDVITCKLLKSLHVVVHAKVNGLCNTKSKRNRDFRIMHCHHIIASSRENECTLT